jgi:hypothetical protein
VSLFGVHVGMDFIDRTSGWIERHVGDVTLEESTTAQLDKTKLAGIDIK